MGFAELEKSFQKSYGQGIGGLGHQYADIERIPTGFYPFDKASAGGIPRGKITELYGVESSCKTNIAMRLIANAQKLWPEKKNVWFDVEASYDKKWAKKWGVDTDALYTFRPDYGESLVDMLEGCLSEPDCGLVVIDSLAAIVTTRELEQSAEKQDVGGSGMVISKMIRKTTAALTRAEKEGSFPTLLCINQTRTKIGVTFGNPECVHGDTCVNFVDGRSIPIRQVVEEKIKGKVWSYDEKTQTFKKSAITAHHYNGKAKAGDYITIKAQAAEARNGILSSTTSYTHRILTQRGWVLAGDIKIGDSVLTRYRQAINGELALFMAGAVCGDMTLAKVSKTRRGRQLRLQDTNNPEYAKWKADLLSPFFGEYRTYPSNGGIRHEFQGRFELDKLHKEANGRSPLYLFNNFSWLGFAVWIMDDAHFALSHERYSIGAGRYANDAGMRESISVCLDKLKLQHKWDSQNKSIVFTVAASARIAKNIAGYIPRCMQYKLPSFLRGGKGLVCLSNVGEKQIPVFMPIISVEPASDRKYRENHLYDITVENDHNYCVGNVANGFVVHNSTFGGTVKNFAYSMRVRLYGKDEVDPKYHDTLPVNKEVKFNIVKHKVPIIAKTGDMSLVMVPHNGLRVGECDDFSLLKVDMIKHGILVQEKTKWVFAGEHEFKTLRGVKDLLDNDIHLATQVKQAIIDTEKERALEDEELNTDTGEEVDPETGEITEEKPKKKGKK